MSYMTLINGKMAFTLPAWAETRVKVAAHQYRTTPAGVIAIMLWYYFGDGKDHLQCEFCDDSNRCNGVYLECEATNGE